MDTESGFTLLVHQARLGDQGAMDCLAETVRQRLYAYLYRLTLNHDLAQDLLQETLLKMVEHIKDLEHPEGFWNWLFRTALGNVQHHYRDVARQRAIGLSAASHQRLSKYLTEDYDDGLNRLMRKELSQTVVEAMARLTLMHRNVVILRCFEQMSYAEIAGLLGCKELRARVIFFRARRALGRQLGRRGFARGLLVTAIGLFGLLTAPADGVAAGAVTAGTLKVGPVAAFAGAAGTAPGIAAAVTIAGAGLTLTMEQFIYFLLLLGLACVCLVIALLWD